MSINEFTDRVLNEGESAKVEFKANPDAMAAIGQVVCAFLNTRGGIVVVGVDDGGTPNGLATAEKAVDIRKFLGEKITPRVLYDVSVDESSMGTVISVGVPAGPDRPYVFEGAAYIRRGNSTVAADAAALRSLVEESIESMTRWERRPAVGLEIGGLELSLLEETVRRAQERRGYRFENPRDHQVTLTQLALLQFGQLTNAADVLFGKEVAIRHPQTRMRAVRFATDRADNFLDEQLFEGPVFKLLEDALAFCKRHVAIGAEFREGKLARDSRPQYPFPALREGLVNALVHRDYAAASGSVSVSVYPDRIEMWNTGRLPRGIVPRDLRLPSHASILVNPDIGHVFYLHELMERVGRGTYKITQECRDLGMKLPEWKNVGSGVRLTMYAAQMGAAASIDLNDRQKQLLDSIRPGEQIQIRDYMERFGYGITDRQGRRDLSDLEASGLLVRHGAGSRTTYERTDRTP